MGKNNKTRVDADNVSLRTQTRSLLLDRLTADADSVALDRDTNTARLKQMRLDKEALQQSAPHSPAPPKQKKTPA